MLERTAASLESCNLQRVISKPTRTTKRCRRLHTGFWQHGASAIELSSIWPLPAQAHDTGAGETSPRPLQTGLAASAFLLDFLYPTGTYSLLRRLYPSLPRPQDGNNAGAASKRRHFTSSTAAPELGQQTRVLNRDMNETSEVRRASHLARSSCGLGLNREPDKMDENGLVDSTNDRFTVEAFNHETSLHSNDFIIPVRKLDAPSLEDLLSRQDEERYNDVWDLYCRMAEEKQAKCRRLMVLYLSKSRGIVETGRAISLFRQVPIDQWDNGLLAAGVLALMRAGDLEHATNRLKAGMDVRGLTGGLEYVLAHTIANQRWSLLIGVWLEFYASRLRFDSYRLPEDIPLKSLQNLPGLDRLFFLFEQYLSTDGAKALRPINLYAASRQAFAALRRKLGELALAQPCQPKQAGAILEIFGDQKLYNYYLTQILHHWRESGDLKANTTWLSEIYRTYREMPGAEPSIPLLRGMFNLHYPDGLDALKEIYQDWRKTWGELDKWGFEKFLKLYAAAGDVQAVQTLWNRYVECYPEVLRKTRAFRSTMNAYAQVGDVGNAEAELSRMTDRYGVQPDLDIWNTLLKCYMRASNYERVVACFHEICKMYNPDSFTYAHVMAMSAKKGDLESTLTFFKQSQKDGVSVSKEMAMSLVMVYCRNDRLVEAERICTELAERKSTSTAIWNQLIHFNGMQGQLNKCYELLQAMKNFEVLWDAQTHAFLLEALVRVDQIQPAYRLLRTAYREKLFPVGPEHFAIVMAGAVRTGEYNLVEVIATHIEQAGQSMNFNAQVSLAEASFRKTPSANRTRQLGREFVSRLRNMMAQDGRQRNRNPAAIVPGDIRYLQNQTKSIGRAIKLLVALRDFGTAEKVVNLYARIFPKYKSVEPFPPDVVSALMGGYAKDKQYDSIIRMWNQTWESLQSQTTHRNSSVIYPAHQYDLSQPINIVAKAFREQNDGKGLLECVEKVTRSGFKLTRSNWNIVIRYLAELGQWEPAMSWCESMLMPRWRGWNPTKRTLQERRHMKNTRVLQASKAAVLSLQHQWLKLRKLAAWSADVSGKLRMIEWKYPRLHYAFTTTDFEHLPSTWSANGRSSLTKGAKAMLKPFSHSELRGMERSLERQLRMEREKRRLPRPRSLFHLVPKKRLRVRLTPSRKGAAQRAVRPSEQTEVGGDGL